MSGKKRVLFEYDIVRMWRQPVQAFLESGFSSLPLAMLCKMPAGKPMEKALQEVRREIERRLATLPDHAQAVRLMTAAYILTSLRVHKRDRVDAIFAGASIMHEKFAWDEAIDEGRIETAHFGLLNVGRILFGTPSPKIEAALTAIDDPDRLHRMLATIANLKSWKALLSVK